MIVMIIIKKKWQSNPQRLGNTIEIEEKKKMVRGRIICISPRMLLSYSFTIRTAREDFEPRQSFDHLFVVSFSAIALIEVIF